MHPVFLLGYFELLVPIYQTTRRHIPRQVRKVKCKTYVCSCVTL